MAIAFTLPTPPLKIFHGEVRQTHVHLFDGPTELADYAAGLLASGKAKNRSASSHDWNDSKTSREAIATFKAGDLSGVAKSDALLSRFESQTIATHKPLWQDSFAGAFPNVGAAILGKPMAMRRRVRGENEGAPIAIVVDIGAASHIERDMIERRGAAILALLRILSHHRPVELWAGAILDADESKNASAHFCRLDTAPLDLARAAHILTSPAAIRGTLWACADAHGFEATTPYGAGQAHSAHTAELLGPAFQGAADTIFLGRINHHEDESIASPETWIERKLCEALPDSGREPPEPYKGGPAVPAPTPTFAPILPLKKRRRRRS